MRRTVPDIVISAAGWKRLVDHFFKHRIIQVLGADPREWQHPWHTVARWDPEAEHWHLAIKPTPCVSATSDGDPTVRIAERWASRETRERLGLPVTAEGSETNRVEAYLSELPRIVVDPGLWRAIGTDALELSADSIEAVPPALARRGVLGATVTETRGAKVVTKIEGLVADRSRARLLRAVDIVLTHERVKTTVTISDDIASADRVSWEFSPETAISTQDAYVTVVRKHEPIPAVSLPDLLSGAVTDTGKDTVRIATVYLLSQPGETPGAEPDGSWQAFVDHNISWPLQYVTRFSSKVPEPTRVGVPLPDLGLGALGDIGGRLTEAINENLSELEAATVQVINQGRFDML